MVVVYARTFRMRLPHRIHAKNMNEDVANPEGMAKRLGIGFGVLPVTSRVFKYSQPELLFTQPANGGGPCLSASLLPPKSAS
jgi:hypothetical protein